MLGHTVDSVNSLRLKGIDNGTLYKEVAVRYDICFTKDKGFAATVKKFSPGVNAKVLLVVLPQQPEKEFVRLFMEHFQNTGWEELEDGDLWPRKA